MKNCLSGSSIGLPFRQFLSHRRSAWQHGLRLCVLLPIAYAAPAVAQVELAPHIQEQMVVQRGTRWVVSGTANDNEQFDVRFLGKEIPVRPSGGTWVAQFDVPSNFSGPADLAVDGGRKIIKVQVGDVWLCAGQSNMAMKISRASDGDRIAKLSRGKSIHLFQVPKPVTKPQPMAGLWMAVSPDRVGDFSAVCLAFGEAIYDRIHVPVGLIDASLGGTWIESWISDESFRRIADSATYDRYARIARQRELRGWRGDTQGIEKPSQLFELMVRPLANQSIKGVFWYQGEGNRSNASRYTELLSMLIQDWRKHWNNPLMPFVVMQLPGNGAPSNSLDAHSAWAAIRDAQRIVVETSPPAGLAVSIDLGDGTIHPKNKLPFGERAAETAFDLVYSQRHENAATMPTGFTVEGSAIRIEFDKGSACVEGTRSLPDMLYISGEDRRWQAADVEVDHSSIVVHSAQVEHPVAVRYAWSDYPQVGLKTCGSAIPVTPFRTDKWTLD